MLARSVARCTIEILRDFDVPFELTIVSAHRTPKRMVEYATTAHQRGLRVIIAAAGTYSPSLPPNVRAAPADGSGACAGGS